MKNGGRTNTNNYNIPTNPNLNTYGNQSSQGNNRLTTNQNSNISNNNYNLTNPQNYNPTSASQKVSDITQGEKKLNNINESEITPREGRNTNVRESNNKSANHYYMDDYYKKYDLENITTPEEEENLKKRKKKKEEAIDHCMMLYERAKIKNEVNKINFYKNMEYKESNELEECTFQPQINERKNKQEENLKLFYKNTQIYNRSIQWKENTQNKIEKNRREIMRDSEESYQPKVNYKTINIHLNIFIY